jgi:hypothetical protein
VSACAQPAAPTSMPVLVPATACHAFLCLHLALVTRGYSATAPLLASSTHKCSGQRCTEHFLLRFQASISGACTACRLCGGTGTSSSALAKRRLPLSGRAGRMGARSLYTKMPILLPAQKLRISIHTPDARCLISTCKIPANSLYKASPVHRRNNGSDIHVAQFLTLCSASNLAEARRVSSLWQGSSPFAPG